MGNSTPREGAEHLASERLPEILDLLEGQLRVGGWLVGDSFTVADIAAGVQMVNLDYVGYALDTTRWPKTSAWLERRGVPASRSCSNRRVPC